MRRMAAWSGRVRVFGVVLGATLFVATAGADNGAPRDGERFVNAAGPRPRAPVSAMVPFLARKVWTSLASREGRARFVPYDAAALAENPSLTWIGHATFLVRMDGVTFLTDPMFSARASPVPFAGPKRLVPPGVPLDALPPIDFVTLSHDHYDHTDTKTIAALAKRGTRFVVGLGMGDLVRAAGGEAIELDWWQTTTIGASHASTACPRSISPAARSGTATAAVGGLGGRGPDAALLPRGRHGLLRRLPRDRCAVGPIDLAAMPIGAYEPNAAIMRFVHVNPEEAVRAGRDVGARRLVGMHWGTFDLTDEPLDEPPRRFHGAAAAAGFAPDDVWTMDVGETRRW
jgi:N-acyl-phosphatidylethanolamine-hydrolysing phospholipase D